MAIAGQWFEIQAGEYSAHVSDVGAGLASLNRAEREVTAPWPADSLPPMSSGGVLLPWPNRIRDGRYRFGGVDFQLPLTEPAQLNASHGLVRWVRWTVDEHTDDAVSFTHSLVAQTGYPFELDFTVRYSLDAVEGLRVSTAVVNQAGLSAPFGAGFHPYLDLGGHDLDHAEVLIPALAMLQTDERQIPVSRMPVGGTPYDLAEIRPLGSLRLDHAFTDLTGSRAEVRVGGRTTQLWWDAEFQYLQVFTPPVERFKRTAIAIEPMTCPADAFNSGDELISLAPGQRWQASWGIRAND